LDLIVALFLILDDRWSRRGGRVVEALDELLEELSQLLLLDALHLVDDGHQLLLDRLDVLVLLELKDQLVDVNLLLVLALLVLLERLLLWVLGRVLLMLLLRRQTLRWQSRVPALLR